MKRLRKTMGSDVLMQLKEMMICDCSEYDDIHRHNDDSV